MSLFSDVSFWTEMWNYIIHFLSASRWYSLAKVSKVEMLSLRSEKKPKKNFFAIIIKTLHHVLIKTNTSQQQTVNNICNVKLFYKSFFKTVALTD